MANNSNMHRKIAIASIAITLLLLSLIGSALILFNELNQLTTPRISLSFQRQIYALQGKGSRIQFEVNSIGDSENITLSGEVTSSNVTCKFRPATCASNFTSTLYVNVPISTPIGNYTVTVFASGNGQVAGASLILSVLNNERVTVSGNVSTASLCNSSISIPYGMHFIDMQTGYETYVDLIGYYPFRIDSPDYPFVLVNHPSDRYSTSLANGQSYKVVIGYFCGTQGNMSVVEDPIGNFTVHAPARKTAIHKDFP